MNIKIQLTIFTTIYKHINECCFSLCYTKPLWCKLLTSKSIHFPKIWLKIPRKSWWGMAASRNKDLIRLALFRNGAAVCAGTFSILASVCRIGNLCKISIIVVNWWILLGGRSRRKLRTFGGILYIIDICFSIFVLCRRFACLGARRLAMYFVVVKFIVVVLI